MIWKLTFCILQLVFIPLLVLSNGNFLKCFLFFQEATDSLKNRNQVQQPVYTTIRLLTEKPVIDGMLNDPCWETGTWAGDFIQFIPHEGARPSQPTEFKILYDDHNIYVAIRACDSLPDKIHRYAGLRDEFIGDIVGICFDSYHDHRTGFEFDLTAYEQKIDLVLTNPMDWDGSWNPVWKGKVGFEDSAWTAEMEIPLNQLRYSRENDQVWGMHIWRWINREQEESDWERQTLTGPGVLYNFGELHGISNLKKHQRLELLPYALGKLSTYPKNENNPYTGDGKVWGGNIGLDAKIGVTSNFTVDLTVNPDFGQVESDPSVMNLSAFEVFYEEKRPFFLEGKTIFDYEFDFLSLFYSRRIGHSPSLEIPESENHYVKAPDQTTILSAAKLSGKTSEGLSMGILQSFTGPEMAETRDTDGHESAEMVEPFTNYLVTRVQKDYNEGSTMIGGIITSTNRFIHDNNLEFLDRNAYTGGLDLLHQWHDREFFIDARLVGSYVEGRAESMQRLQESSVRYYQRPDADYVDYDTARITLKGTAGRFKIGKGANGLWRYSTGFSWFSPGLELNDIGYMQYTDEIRQENNVSYFVNRPVGIFRTYSLSLREFNLWNFGMDYMGSGAHFSFMFEFKNKWNTNNKLIFHTPFTDLRLLRGGPSFLIPGTFLFLGHSRSDISKKFWFSMFYQVGVSAEHSNKMYQVGPGIHLRPVNTITIMLSASYTRNDDQLQYVSTEPHEDKSRYVLGTIHQNTLEMVVRADYNITPQFSIQYYGSPFVSKGEYSEFKYVTHPHSTEYAQRFSVYEDPFYSEGRYWLDENLDGLSDYSVTDPDFNFHQFRSNLVAKWEYRPGSFIYLVWSGDRTGHAEPVNAGWGESLKQLGEEFSNNIFLLKLNYWFAL